MSHINRILHLQSEMHNLFPRMQNAYTVAIAQAVTELVDANVATGTDPYPDVQAKIRVLAPDAHAPQLSYQVAALVLIEQDAAWRTLHPGEFES